MNIAKLLGLMGEHKHTQADIANHLNIASSTLTLKLSGKTEISLMLRLMKMQAKKKLMFLF